MYTFVHFLRGRLTEGFYGRLCEQQPVLRPLIWVLTTLLPHMLTLLICHPVACTAATAAAAAAAAAAVEELLPTCEGPGHLRTASAVQLEPAASQMVLLGLIS
jgi:hypothetical protein